MKIFKLLLPLIVASSLLHGAASGYESSDDEPGSFRVSVHKTIVNGVEHVAIYKISKGTRTLISNFKMADLEKAKSSADLPKDKK